MLCRHNLSREIPHAWWRRPGTTRLTFLAWPFHKTQSRRRGVSLAAKKTNKDPQSWCACRPALNEAIRIHIPPCWLCYPARRYLWHKPLGRLSGTFFVILIRFLCLRLFRLGPRTLEWLGASTYAKCVEPWNADRVCDSTCTSYQEIWSFGQYDNLESPLPPLLTRCQSEDHPWHNALFLKRLLWDRGCKRSKTHTPRIAWAPQPSELLLCLRVSWKEWVPLPATHKLRYID
jgi:hypothetical protein